MYREFVDIHSHILPKTDDGSVSMDESIQILRKMCKIGVSELFVTPHFCKRRGYTKSVGEILDVYYDLRNMCIAENIPIKLHLGTEMEYSQDGQRYIYSRGVCTPCSSRGSNPLCKGNYCTRSGSGSCAYREIQMCPQKH